LPEFPDIAFKKVMKPKTSSMPAQNGLGFHPPHPTGKADAHIVGLRQEPWFAPETLGVVFRKEMTPKAQSTPSQEGWIFTLMVTTVKRDGRRQQTHHLVSLRTAATNNATMATLAYTQAYRCQHTPPRRRQHTATQVDQTPLEAKAAVAMSTTLLPPQQAVAAMNTDAARPDCARHHRDGGPLQPRSPQPPCRAGRRRKAGPIQLRTPAPAQDRANPGATMKPGVRSLTMPSNTARKLPPPP
jgi:hypothetical protein